MCAQISSSEYTSVLDSLLPISKERKLNMDGNFIRFRSTLGNVENRSYKFCKGKGTPVRSVFKGLCGVWGTHVQSCVPLLCRYCRAHMPTQAAAWGLESKTGDNARRACNQGTSAVTWHPLEGFSLDSWGSGARTFFFFLLRKASGDVCSDLRTGNLGRFDDW